MHSAFLVPSQPEPATAALWTYSRVEPGKPDSLVDTANTARCVSGEFPGSVSNLQKLILRYALAPLAEWPHHMLSHCSSHRKSCHHGASVKMACFCDVVCSDWCAVHLRWTGAGEGEEQVGSWSIGSPVGTPPADSRKSRWQPETGAHC
jgi:hypothetical protein